MTGDHTQVPGDALSVSDLTAGLGFTGAFACARKDRLTSRNGSTYLALELRDRTGTIPARLFREADQASARFDRGDAIEVKGRVERFRGQLVAELDAIRKLEPGTYDAERFLPAGYRDRDELEGFLEHLAGEVHEEALRQIVRQTLFESDSAAEFRRAPCTRAGHHAYLGGLLEHTVAVATLVTETCALHPRLNSDILMAAALLHDIGKTREFSYGAEIALTEQGRMLGHLQLGAEILAPYLANLPEDLRTTLTATVMCHHGTDALRLSRFPSPEAIALYRLNALDAQVKGALEHGI